MKAVCSRFCNFCKESVWKKFCVKIVWGFCKESFWRRFCIKLVWGFCKEVWKTINPKRYVLDTLIILRNVFSVLSNARLGWYLVVGVVIMGGSGVLLTWVKYSFNIYNIEVAKAALIFILTLVGTSVFDLMYSYYSNLIHKKNVYEKSASWYLELIAIAVIFSICVAYLYYKSNPSHAKVIMQCLLPLSLCYWLAVNANDAKFNCDTIEQGGAGGSTEEREGQREGSEEIKCGGKW